MYSLIGVVFIVAISVKAARSSVTRLMFERSPPKKRVKSRISSSERKRSSTIARNGWRAGRERPRDRVAHVLPERVDLERERRVRAVPVREERVVGQPLRLGKRGPERDAGAALAVGPGPIRAAQRHRLRHQVAVHPRRDTLRVSPRAPGARPGTRARRRRRPRSRGRRPRPAGGAAESARAGPRRSRPARARLRPEASGPRARAAARETARCRRPRASRPGRRASPRRVYSTSSAIVRITAGSLRGDEQRRDRRLSSTPAAGRGCARSGRPARSRRRTASGTAAIASARLPGEEQLLDLARPRPRSPCGPSAPCGSCAASRPCRRCRSRASPSPAPAPPRTSSVMFTVDDACAISKPRLRLAARATSA